MILRDPIATTQRRRSIVKTKTEVMTALKAAGTAQTVKTYARHGIAGKAFGVRYADIYAFVKQIGPNQKLADQLWKTGVHDARVLATMIAEPEKMTAAAINEWVKTADNQLTLDSIAALAGRTKHARSCMDKWIKHKNEWIAAAGWHLLAGGCCGRPGQPPTFIDDEPDSYFIKKLDHIEETIHGERNRVKHSMNGALIAIGMRSSELTKRAIAAATRIGKVEVDHGDTSCKTPDAVPYIKKAVAHASKRKTSKKKTASPARKKTARKKVAVQQNTITRKKTTSKKRPTKKKRKIITA